MRFFMQDDTSRGGRGPRGREALIPTSGGIAVRLHPPRHAEYDVKGRTRYALVVAGSDAPRWRTCDELIITLGGAA
jgi:hypothetical protein